MLIVPSELFFNGVARVEFLFFSYQMNMYLFPDLDNIGNLPARSIYFLTWCYGLPLITCGHV